MFLKLKQCVRKGAAVLFGLLLCCTALTSQAAATEVATDAIPGWPVGPAQIYGDTAVLMEASTGAVLYDKGMDEVRYPASITKIMTAIIALENSSLSDPVTFTDTACALAVPGNAKIDAKPGEVLTMEQCLYALMLSSANEVGCQIAIQIAGSEAAFADMMNAKAAELGCTSTHFTNASGLHDDNHYTTAHDMARIMQYAIKNQEFLKITGTTTYVIPATNMSGERTLSTHNAMMVPGSYYYEGTFSGKSGNTNEAGSTLVTTVTRNQMTLICVVLKTADGGQSVSDTIALMDYGYNNFSLSNISLLNPEMAGTIVLPKGIDTSTLILQENSTDSSASCYYQNQYLGTVTKVPDTEEDPKPEVSTSPSGPSSLPDINQQPSSESSLSTSQILIIVLIVMIAAGIAAILTGLKRNKKSQKKRH